MTERLIPRHARPWDHGALAASYRVSRLCHLGWHRWMTLYAVSQDQVLVHCARCGKETMRRR